MKEEKADLKREGSWERLSSEDIRAKGGLAEACCNWEGGRGGVAARRLKGEGDRAKPTIGEPVIW